MKTILPFLFLLSFACGCMDRREIEYFPLTGKYYPKYNGKYIEYFNTEETFSLGDNPNFSTKYANDSIGAVRILDRYLEFTGVGTKIIKLQ